MVQQLWIQNYAIIEEVDIHFSTQMTTITGETGAGKSIIMGALGLILGERADTKVLYQKEEKCIVEGTFQIASYQLQPFFEKYDLDYDPECIIRREINPSGKSRAFINDTPTKLSILKELSQYIIDLHRQFDTLDINQISFQFKTLDALSDQKKEVLNYRSAFQEWQKLKEKYATLQEKQQERAREREFLNFQLEELMELDYQAGEWFELDQKLNTLSHVEELKSAFHATGQVILESEPSLDEVLSELIHKYEKAGPAAEPLLKRLQEVQIELEDIAREAEQEGVSIEYDPAEQERIEDRMQDIYQLQQKHQLEEPDDLKDRQTDLESQLNRLESDDAQLEELAKAIHVREKTLRSQAKEISKNRRRIIPEFQEQVAKRLQAVSMPNAVFKVELESVNELQPAGIDRVEFTFSANKGAPTGKIRDIASGGELSRLALAIKSIVAAAIPLPTLMFDEIDSGVSGDVALKMGHILKSLSRNHQVIVITHSPQISAQGDLHYFVYKETNEERTFTRVKSLEGSDRAYAIATMLSSDPPSEAALANAKDLLQLQKE
jgi:DNA repair protein RecN (Recombination protein N)